MPGDDKREGRKMQVHLSGPVPKETHSITDVATSLTRMTPALAFFL
jgi:hypothetical protein